MQKGAIDIGNTRVKFLVNSSYASFIIDENFEFNLFYFLADALIPNFLKNIVKEIAIEKLTSFLQEYLTDNPLLFGISYVNKMNLSKVETALSKLNNINLIDIKPIAEKREILWYDIEAGFGIDRALGIIGAMNYSEPPLITVDCGTALTINPVTKDRVSLGGTISAGVFLQLYALLEKAEQLKNVKLSYYDIVSGKDTNHCISSGIIYGMAGAIKNIYYKIVEQEFAEYDYIPVFLTGGASDLITPALSDWEIELIHNKTLVLEGILKLI